MPIVENHMTRDLVTIGSDATVVEAARQMAARRVGAILVLGPSGLCGILTERDVLQAVALGLTDEARVAEWMTRNPETVSPSDTTEHAAVLMLHGGFRHLPVADKDGGVVGILSIRDVMGVAIQHEAPRGV
jgi:CBS domain-containing protein